MSLLKDFAVILKDKMYQVVSIYYEGVKTNKILKNQLGVICIEETPFYAEAGGQIGDIGIIKSQGVRSKRYESYK